MNWPPRRILVGTDFSPCATAAVRAAGALARRVGARLELAHVLPDATAHAHAVVRLEELARELAPERCRIHLPEGVPAVELLALRELAEVDLLVLGAAGHGGLRRLLVGSVADRILRHPGCPLLLVHEAPPSGELKRVLIAHEYPDASSPWLELGTRIAEDERSEVVVLHVAPARGYASDAHHVDLEPGRAPHRLGELIARVAPTTPTQIDVRRGDAADEIPAAARAHAAQLVVLGAERNASGWPGRVADRVARAGLPAVLFVWPGSESAEEFDER
jgi:nucleotide-binding universal stress UspA family protein